MCLEDFHHKLRRIGVLLSKKVWIFLPQVFMLSIILVCDWLKPVKMSIYSPHFIWNCGKGQPDSGPAILVRVLAISYIIKYKSPELSLLAEKFKTKAIKWES